jgi:hypothetical protein
MKVRLNQINLTPQQIAELKRQLQAANARLIAVERRSANRVGFLESEIRAWVNKTVAGIQGPLATGARFSCRSSPKD